MTIAPVSGARVIISIAGTSHPTLTPRGTVPFLKREQNQIEICILEIQPIDRVTGKAIDLSVIVPFDTVDLTGEAKFFGIITDVKSKRIARVGEAIVITATDELFRYTRQLNRPIFNGYRDLVAWPHQAILDGDTNTNLIVSPLLAQFNADKTLIEPLKQVQRYRPHGLYSPANITVSFTSIGREMRFNTAGDERKIAIVFQPRRSSITKLWLNLLDRVELPGSIANNIRKDLIFELVETEVIEGADSPIDIFPGTVLVKTEQDKPARRRLSTSVKETWETATGGITGSGAGASGTFGSNSFPEQGLEWQLLTGVDDDISIIAAVSDFDFGANKLARLIHNAPAGNFAKMETLVPARATNVSDSGWVHIQFSPQTAAITAIFRIFVNNDQGPSPTLACSVGLSPSGVGSEMDLTINYGDGQTKIIPSLEQIPDPASTKLVLNGEFVLIFRIRPERMEFDVFLSETELTVDSVGILNADFILRDGFSEPPNRISKYEIEVLDGSAAGELDIGYVSGNEMGTERIRANTWSQIDFSDDPVVVNPGQWYALVGRIGTDLPLGTDDHISLVVTNPLNAGHPISPMMRFMSFNDTAGTWFRSSAGGDGTGTPFEFPFLVEYPDSWIDIRQSLINVDSDNNRIIWAITSRTNFLPFINAGGSTGPDFTFQDVRVSEYVNPTTKGIIQPASVMHADDIVKELISLEPNDPTSGTTSFSAVYTTRQVDVYVTVQTSILQALKEFAMLQLANMFLTASATPTLVFEELTTIENIDITESEATLKAAHKYILCSEKDIIDPVTKPEFFHTFTSKLGETQTKVFTSFSAYGKDPSIRQIKRNPVLFATLGDIPLPPETFPKVEDPSQLLDWVNMLEVIHGSTIIEGEVIVAGYFPFFTDGRLDTNGIVRVIDATLPNGTDITGTANVFRILWAMWSIEEEKTTLFLTNRGVNHQSEEDLTRARKSLQGTNTDDAEKDIVRSGLGVSAGGMAGGTDTRIFMALVVNGREMPTRGYRRRLCRLFVHTNGEMTYQAHFPENNGTVENDEELIDEIRLFDNVAPTFVVAIALSIASNYTVTVDGTDFIYGSTFKKLPHGGATGTFVLGEEVTETTGGGTDGVGIIKQIVTGAGFLIVDVTAGDFDSGSVITGTDSTAIATMSANQTLATPQEIADFFVEVLNGSRLIRAFDEAAGSFRVTTQVGFQLSISGPTGFTLTEETIRATLDLVADSQGKAPKWEDITFFGSLDVPDDDQP